MIEAAENSLEGQISEPTSLALGPLPGLCTPLTKLIMFTREIFVHLFKNSPSLSPVEGQNPEFCARAHVTALPGEGGGYSVSQCWATELWTLLARAGHGGCALHLGPCRQVGSAGASSARPRSRPVESSFVLIHILQYFYNFPKFLPSVWCDFD